MYGNPGMATQPMATASQIQNQRQSQVQSEISRSGKLIEALSQHISNLHQRLQPVLRDCPTAPSGKSEKAVLVGHAMALSNQSDQLEELCSEVGSILERIEL